MDTEYTCQQHSGPEFHKLVREVKSRQKQPNPQTARKTGSGNSASDLKVRVKYEKRLNLLKQQADGNNFAAGAILARTLRADVH